MYKHPIRDPIEQPYKFLISNKSFSWIYSRAPINNTPEYPPPPMNKSFIYLIVRFLKSECLRILVQNFVSIYL